MRTRVRVFRVALRAALAAGLAAAVLIGGTPPPAAAQSTDEVAGARRLFAEALRDQEAGRFEMALEKFEQVRKIKDTPPIWYRIGNCEEALGRMRRAARSYEAAIALSEAGSGDEDVRKAARTRLAIVGARAARLAVVLRGHAAGPRMAVDGELFTEAELESGVWLDPGQHVVTVTAADAPPARTEIALPAGGRASITVALEPQTKTAEPRPEVTPPESPQRTIGFITLGVGGACLVASGVALLLRAADISDLNASCPDGHCPPDRESELSHTRKRALFEGPLAATLGAIGVAAAGTGIFLVLTAPVRVVPVASAHGGGMLVEGLF